LAALRYPVARHRIKGSALGLVGFVVAVRQEFFGVVEGVGAGLAAVEVSGREPLGVAVEAFSGAAAAEGAEAAGDPVTIASPRTMSPSGSRAAARLPGISQKLVVVMASMLTACSGFLFAVLWMDLIFDVQVLRHRKATTELPEAVLACIAAYYHRATTTSRPMGRLIVLVMLTFLGTLVLQAARGHDPGWLLVTSAPLAGIPVMLALTHTVPDAVQLGRRTDSPTEQTRLARSICRDHLLSAACMLTFLILWVADGAAI
jgi:hypothetical protein